MNIINKVTFRHLIKNKRRTLVTMIGIIISVAMITAVATLGISFLDLMTRQYISHHGEWHVQYKDVTPDQIEAIEHDSETDKLTLSSDGYALLEESDNEYKPYLYFKNFNKTGMEQFPIELYEGSLPDNENEIAISKEIISNAKVDYNIGDKLTFDIGERWSNIDEMMLNQNDSLERDEDSVTEQLQINESIEVTIVGIIDRPVWETSWSPGYTVIGYVDENSWNESTKIDALVALTNVKSSLYGHAKSLAQDHGIETVNYNSDLLRFHGVTANDELRKTLYSLVAIIMAIIIIGSVALIYNAFAISVSERAKHLGMLSSVGATKKQKRNSVFFEGAIIGAISIPIGILAGLIGIGVTFSFINKYLQGALGTTEKLELVVTPASILVACGVSVLTIFISTYIPARKASNISAIDAIRQTHDVKLSGKTVKTSKLVRKIFGLEAEIGLKNVKRNKKRYLATVFSLVISIVLFLTVSYFAESLKKSLDMAQADIQYDIQVYSSQLDKEELMTFTNLDYVTKSAIIDEVDVEAFIEFDELPELLKAQIKENNLVLEDEEYQYYVVLYSLDQDSFNEYAEQIGASPEEFTQTDQPTGIVIDQITYEDVATRKVIETKSIETNVGNTIDIYSRNYEELEMDEPTREFVGSIQVGALTDQAPMGVHTHSIGGLGLIVSEETLGQLAISREQVNSYIYLNSSDPMATQAEIEERDDTSIHVYNVHERRQQQEQMVLLMAVFTYGFITLITLISIANIFNTISTSISLRKREFAMLRSIGMTPKGFNKMIQYESIFYGIKALGYGLPISLLVMIGIHRSTGFTFDYRFELPWLSILFVIIMIFFIVGSAMLYSIAKIKNENIIESLKQENI